MNELYMKEAYKEALIAFELDEVPVGALIVKDGEIIAKAHNMREKEKNSTRHAEIIVIEKACKKLNTWRLDDCIIYTTLEPCMMCMGAIMESRISKVICGCKRANKCFNYTVPPKIEADIMKSECLTLLQTFFKNKR